MATIEMIVGNTTYNLRDGTLFDVESISGIETPPIRRLRQSSPQQHGSTDLGVRLGDRVIQMSGHFRQTTRSAYDTRRAAIMAALHPSGPTRPIKLKWTLDSGDVRQVDVHLDSLVMARTPEHRLSQSVIARFLTDNDPLFYNPTLQTTNIDNGDTDSNWWLGLGSIPAANVLDNVTSPSQGTSIDSGALVSDGDPWSVFIRTNAASLATNETLFEAQADGAAGVTLALFTNNPPGAGYLQTSEDGAALMGMQTGSHDYFVVMDGIEYWSYRDTTVTLTGRHQYGIDGSEASSRWRSTWTPALDYGAVYDIALSSQQRAAIVAHIGGSYVGYQVVNYSGNFASYPILRLEGPITNPIIWNYATGEKLDLTGTALSADEVYTFDCRFGYKTVTDDSGVSQISNLSNDSDLATFHLGADPEVTDGENGIALLGSGDTSATKLSVIYFNRYLGI